MWFWPGSSSVLGVKREGVVVGAESRFWGAGLGLTGEVLGRLELGIRGSREGVMVGPESRFWEAGLGLTVEVLARCELRIGGG